MVATPIGNLGDLAPRAVEELARADLVCCEDTRRTGRPAQHAGVGGPTLRRVDAHTEADGPADVVARIAAGARVALVTDAGTPGVSDPGARLVAAVVDGRTGGDHRARARWPRSPPWCCQRVRHRPLRRRRLPAPQGGRAQRPAGRAGRRAPHRRALRGARPGGSHPGRPGAGLRGGPAGGGGPGADQGARGGVAGARWPRPRRASATTRCGARSCSCWRGRHPQRATPPTATCGPRLRAARDRGLVAGPGRGRGRGRPRPSPPGGLRPGPRGRRARRGRGDPRPAARGARRRHAHARRRHRRRPRPQRRWPPSAWPADASAWPCRRPTPPARPSRGRLPVRPGGPPDGAAIAAVERRAWRAGYRGVVSDAFLDGLDLGYLGGYWTGRAAVQPVAPAPPAGGRTARGGPRRRRHRTAPVTRRPDPAATSCGEVRSLHVDPTVAGRGSGVGAAGRGRVGPGGLRVHRGHALGGRGQRPGPPLLRASGLGGRRGHPASSRPGPSAWTRSATGWDGPSSPPETPSVAAQVGDQGPSVGPAGPGARRCGARSLVPWTGGTTATTGWTPTLPWAVGGGDDDIAFEELYDLDELAAIEAGPARVRPELPPDRISHWRRHSALGAVITGLALGYQEVFDPEEERSIVIEVDDEGAAPRPARRAVPRPRLAVGQPLHRPPPRPAAARRLTGPAAAADRWTECAWHPVSSSPTRACWQGWPARGRR